MTMRLPLRPCSLQPFLMNPKPHAATTCGSDPHTSAIAQLLSNMDKNMPYGTRGD